MAIESADVQLVQSKIMLDVPEGGQGPTGIVIPDGVSNAIFPDVSDLDRTVGRVNGRQVHTHIDTNDREMYLGSYMGIDKPPTDPNISVTIVDTGNDFDTREDAFNRIAAYLTIGPNYAGYLFGNHIAGMQTITIFQRSDVVPPIGSAMALIKRQGFSDEVQQYIRIIDVSVVKTQFEDSVGVYDRNVVSLTLSDSLRSDFPGFDITRYEIDSNALANKTKVASTVVANAATYKGVAQLAEDAELGDFSVKVTSIFTQLVPSAQTETPIADARTNQLSVATVSTGAAITINYNTVFTTANAMFIGGAIQPGTLTVVRDGITVTDDGGKLMSSAVQKGNVDYENGILTLSDNVFGTGGGNHGITYTPAAVPTAVARSQGFDITEPNRALNYVRTILPAPRKGSLSVSYRSQGNWYTLRDNGSGELRGDDVAYGAGNMNSSTGTVSVTLGALPDVDGMLIYQWVPPETESGDLNLDNNGKFYWPINADGNQTEDTATVAYAPGGFSMAWNDGTARTITDDGAGNLTGYGTGTINYAQGVAKVSPTTLPAPGTQITVTRDVHARLNASFAVSDLTTEWHFTVGAAVKPGTVWFQMPTQRKFKLGAGPLSDFGDPIQQLVIDDGTGNLISFVSMTRDNAWVFTVGSIDYPTGNIVIDKSITLTTPQAAVATKFDNMYLLVANNPGSIIAARS